MALKARGATSESDVDLLIVLKGPVTSIEGAKRTSRIATEAAACRDTALLFMHISVEEIADGRRPLLWSVREDGIDLLELFYENTPSTLDFSPG